MDPAHLPDGAEAMMDGLGELTTTVGELREAAERGDIAASLPALRTAVEGAQRHFS